MNGVAVLVAYSHHGWGGLGSTIAHAAIWSVVARIVWHAGPVLVAVIAAVAVIWVVVGPGWWRKDRRP